MGLFLPLSLLLIDILFIFRLALVRTKRSLRRGVLVDGGAGGKESSVDVSIRFSFVRSSFTYFAIVAQTTCALKIVLRFDVSGYPVVVRSLFLRTGTHHHLLALANADLYSKRD